MTLIVQPAASMVRPLPVPFAVIRPADVGIRKAICRPRVSTGSIPAAVPPPTPTSVLTVATQRGALLGVSVSGAELLELRQRVGLAGKMSHDALSASKVPEWVRYACSTRSISLLRHRGGTRSPRRAGHAGFPSRPRGVVGLRGRAQRCLGRRLSAGGAVAFEAGGGGGGVPWLSAVEGRDADGVRRWARIGGADARRRAARRPRGS